MRPARFVVALACFTFGLGITSPAGAAPADAQINLAKTVGPPTTTSSLTGIGFGASETVDITFDGGQLRRARTGPGGRFATTITIPRSALPGPHTIQATGEGSGLSAQAIFTVRTDWPMFHGGLIRSG